MVAEITCEVTCNSSATHVQHLLTGFHCLARSGIVRFSQNFDPELLGASSDPTETQRTSRSQLRVALSARGCRTLVLHFDNHDAAGLNPIALSRSDLYFKRSYSRGFVREHHPADADRVEPLGLYFPVYPDLVDWRAARRNVHFATGWRSRIRGVALALGWRRPVNYLPRISEVEALPDHAHRANVLFLAAAYDPFDDPSRPAASIQERVDNNESRAAVIRGLKAEFGSRFVGGFAPSKFSLEHYGDITVEDRDVTSRPNYVRLLRSHSIGVATTGLHGSIGAKFAEYVAASKAIVCEPLRYEVPGGLSPSSNYLEFRSVGECVEVVDRLVTDRELRLQLMHDNARYYWQHARPDVLVLNALLKAIELWR